MLNILHQIKDFRRAQGKRYQLEYVLLFSILAILSNSKSYRDVATFMQVNFKLLKRKFKLKWKDPPAYTTIRTIIQSVDSKELEKAFREYTTQLTEFEDGDVVAFDGKTVRGSFDKFTDQKAIHVLSAFLTEKGLILGHKSVTEDKTNEIPKLIELLGELNLSDCIVTADALHCQKKL